MSNDLILAIRGQLANVPGGVDEDTRAVAGGGGGGNKRISIKGGVFRKYVGGKEVGAVDERYMNVVFVKMAHNPARTYYAQGYKEGEKISPICWSSDSKTPDAAVRSPQASKCEACPHSIKGSGQGGTGTACRLSWRTAVVLPGDPAGDVMQLVLPATSCFGKEEGGKYPFRAYIQMLANNNISASRVVTRMAFDTKSPVPKLLFSPISAVDTQDIAVITEQSHSVEAENAVKLTVFQQDEGEAPAQPKKEIVTSELPEEETVAVAAEATDEPVLREVKKQEFTAAPDATSVINKWKKAK